MYVRFPLSLRQVEDLLYERGSILLRGDERHRKCRTPEDRALAQQSGREFTSAIPTTRTSDGEIQECKVASELCLDPRFSPQSLLPGTSFIQPRKLQTQSFRRLGGVASTCDLRSTDDGVLLTGSISPDNAQRGRSPRPPTRRSSAKADRDCRPGPPARRQAGTGIMNSNPEQDGTAHRDRTRRLRRCGSPSATLSRSSLLKPLVQGSADR